MLSSWGRGGGDCGEGRDTLPILSSSSVIYNYDGVTALTVDTADAAVLVVVAALAGDQVVPRCAAHTAHSV